VWVKRSKQTDSIYQKLVKVMGGKDLHGLKVLLGRAPMAMTCPLEIRVVTKADPEWRWMAPEVIYVNSLVQAINGGDYDGDSIALYKGDRKQELYNLEMLLETLQGAAGDDGLARARNGVIAHGGEYLGDWYEVKSVAKIWAKRLKGFVVSEEEAIKSLSEGEKQHSVMVGAMYRTAFTAAVQGHSMTDALFFLYERVLGGYDPDLFGAWKAHQDILLRKKVLAGVGMGFLFQDWVREQPNPWVGLGLSRKLEKTLPLALEATDAVQKAMWEGDLQAAFPGVLLGISRGEIPEKIVERYQYVKEEFWKGTVAHRIMRRWVETMLPAFLAHLKKTSGDDGDGGATVDVPKSPAPNPTPAPTLTPQPRPCPQPCSCYDLQLYTSGSRLWCAPNCGAHLLLDPQRGAADALQFASGGKLVRTACYRGYR
jgi:hypothetical protein